MLTLEEYWKQIKQTIDNRLSEVITEKEEVAFDTIFVGGKRLRPTLCLLVFDTLVIKKRKKKDKPEYEKKRKQCIDYACAIEIGHDLSLVVDDIIDDDDERHGEMTLSKLEGISNTILKVVGGLTYPYEILAKDNPKGISDFAQTQRKIVKGAIKELLTPKGLMTGWYEEVVVLKTASAFASAAKAGADCAGASKEIQALFYTFGESCGKAFQYADDITDLKKIFYGKKTPDAFGGTEKLLLMGMNVETIVSQFFNDAVNHKIDMNKGKKLWANFFDGKHTVMQEKRLDMELKKANDALLEIQKEFEKSEIEVSAEHMLLLHQFSNYIVSRIKEEVK